MARIRFCSFYVVFFSSLGGEGGNRRKKYLSHPLPAGWQEQDAMFQQALPVDDHWWKVFEDVTLDSLIRVAVKQNPSALMAMNRMDMAKANLRILRAGILSFLVTRCRVEQAATSWILDRTVSVACGVF